MDEIFSRPHRVVGRRIFFDAVHWGGPTSKRLRDHGGWIVAARFCAGAPMIVVEPQRLPDDAEPPRTMEMWVKRLNGRLVVASVPPAHWRDDTIIAYPKATP